jgi:hypothetical protein
MAPGGLAVRAQQGCDRMARAFIQIVQAQGRNAGQIIAVLRRKFMAGQVGKTAILGAEELHDQVLLATMAWTRMQQGML